MGDRRINGPDGPPPGKKAREQRLSALVRLLADDAAAVRSPAEAALRSVDATPAELRALAEAIDDPAPRARARARLEELRLAGLEAELVQLVSSGNPDLETGAFLLARFHYPELDVAPYVRVLDAMADELREKLVGSGPRERARSLRHLIHDVRGFQGNREAYDDPENVFLNRVLDRRVGIPTSLSCVYLLVGRRLGIPLEGVNLPLHFLVRCADAEGETFIDAFAHGRFLTRTDCREFLKGAGLEERPEFLVRASDRQVLSRLARSLVASFRARGLAVPAERFERCLAIVHAENAP